MADAIQTPTPRKRRWWLRLVLTVLLLAGVTTGLVYWRLRAPLPDVTGTAAVDGLRDGVRVIRDVDHVPHIRAASEADAQFALGYVHAQERLWQMEFQRRVAFGRLSEFAGPATLDTDRLMRTIGIGRAATETWQKLDPAARAVIESYVAGVNAFLADHRGGGLPVEFALLRVTPEPFRSEDVIAWFKTMAWLLSANWQDELLRVRLAAQVGQDGADELMPAYTASGPVILPPEELQAPLPATPLPLGPGVPVPLAPSAPAQPPGDPAPGIRGGGDLNDALAPLDALAAGLHGLVESPMAPALTGASNNWVVAGKRTATGKPLLANDPHLAGGTPGIWYLAHLTGGELDVMGATVPGIPGVLIGHNAHIAWGITALLADVQDLYIEHVSPADQVEFAGTWEPMRVVRDVIKVRGGDDVPMRVRITRHGPLVSDAIAESTTALALRWTGHDADDQSAAAVFALNRAGNWAEFNLALARVHAPALNFVYGDTAGNIGYVGPGAFPVRLNGNGRAPAPGWTGDHEWRGYIHEKDFPRAFNPERGALLSANNRVAPPSYPFQLGSSWEAPYRAARISELLDAATRLTVDDFVRMQRDLKTAQAAVAVPFLLKARPADTRARDAMDRLREWDGTMAGDRPEPALFDAWYEAAMRRLLEDDLGASLFAEYWRVRNTSAKAFDGFVQQGEPPWCDDERTPDPETCATTLGLALSDALDAMGPRQGTQDVSKWRWDRVNTAVFPHAVFETVPALRKAFSRRAPAGGNSFTINPVMYIGADVYSSSYRQIVDLASWDSSLFVIPVGQSGHVWSEQYDSLLQKWRKVEYLPMRFSQAAVDDAAASTMTLQPR